jgi:hypothetical protein
MTEQKKDYILDALGELKDDFVAEAASYTKQKAGWKYWRELGAAAACVAAILVTVKTVEHLPIDRTTESMVTSEKTNLASSNEKEAFKEELVIEATMSQDAVTTQEEKVSAEKEILTYSEGISWELVVSELDVSKESSKDTNDRAQQQMAASPESVNNKYNVLESVQSGSSLVWLSAEELLAQGYDIFRGVVTKLQVYRVTGKMNQYFTVATVEVTDGIRSNQQKGDICEIYLPVAKVDDMIIVNSVSGDLDKLAVGSSAIFMPRTATETTGLGKKDLGEWLCYADVADYYFSEAERYLFLETESGVSYEKNVYEIPGENITLDDVAEYLRKMLED